MKRIAIIITAVGWLFLTASGCGWMGRTAAKTENAINTGAKKIETKIEKMDKDFKDAYNEEKARQ